MELAKPQSDMKLRIGLYGPDLHKLATALPGRFLTMSPPSSLSIDYQDARVGPTWLTQLTRSWSGMAKWPEDEASFLAYQSDTIIKAGGLRELECWTIVEGMETLLDLNYHPTPVAPAWVQALEA